MALPAIAPTFLNEVLSNKPSFCVEWCGYTTHVGLLDKRYRHQFLKNLPRLKEIAKSVCPWVAMYAMSFVTHGAAKA